MTKTLKRFINNESGATAIEYGLIAGIMATILIDGSRHVQRLDRRRLHPYRHRDERHVI